MINRIVDAAARTRTPSRVPTADYANGTLVRVTQPVPVQITHDAIHGYPGRLAGVTFHSHDWSVPGGKRARPLCSGSLGLVIPGAVVVCLSVDPTHPRPIARLALAVEPPGRGLARSVRVDPDPRPRDNRQLGGECRGGPGRRPVGALALPALGLAPRRSVVRNPFSR
jgi:hypothetical protein